MKRSPFLLLALLGAACNSNLQLEQGRLFACDRDGGSAASVQAQCPGRFICGLEGYCHSPDAGEPWLCGDDVDCTAGWRCGLRVDAGVGRCQSTSVAAAYPCVAGDDSTCERGWRCGPEGVCIDPSSDSLEVADGGEPVAELVSPKLPVVEHLSVGYPVYDFFNHFYDCVTATWTSDAGMTRAAQCGIRMGLEDGGLDRTDYLFDVQHDDAQHGPVAVAAETSFVAKAGELVSSTVSFDSTELSFTASTGTVPLQFSGLPKGLAAMDYGFSSTPVLVWDDTHLDVVDTTLMTDQWQLPLPNPAEPLGLLVTARGNRVAAATASTLAAYAWNYYDPEPTRLTDGGIWTYPTWDAGTPPPGLFPIDQLRIDEGWITTLGGPAHDTLWGLPVVWPDSYSNDPVSFVEVAPPSCAACPAGGRPVRLLKSAEADATHVSSRVQCLVEDGGVWAYEASHRLTFIAGLTNCYAGGLASVDLATYEDIQSETSAALRFGQLVCAEPGSPVEHLTLAALPKQVMGTGPGLTAFTTSRSDSTRVDLFTVQSPLLGLTPRQGDLRVQLLGTMRNRPGWFVTMAPSSTTGAMTVAVSADLSGSAIPAELPVIADEASAGASGTVLDGASGSWVFVAAYDTLHAAFAPQGTLSTDGGAPLALPVRVVPLSRQPIVGFVAAPGPQPLDGGIPLPFGYLAVQGRAFRFEARSLTSWRDDEILVPQGEVVDVWLDGTRPRAGLRDGTIVGLRTRVSLSQPLPNGATARGYAQAQGTVFVAASDGLYRLAFDAAQGPLGTWVHETRIESLLPEGAAAWRGQVLLRSEGSELQVFTERGSVARLSYP